MPRVLYAPALGLAVLLAAALTAGTDMSRRPVGARRGVRAAVAGAGAGVLLVLALAMVGVQDGFSRRGRMDRELLAQVRRLMPDPAPGSVLVPVRVDPPAQPPSAMRFESYYWNVVSTWWSARWALRLAYRRSDLDAGHATWGGSGWRSPALDGVYIQSVGRVPWERVIPFEVDGSNTVRLITGARFVGAGGQERVVRIPQTAALAERGLVPEREFVFPVMSR
jgi:hypothetical protein